MCAGRELEIMDVGMIGSQRAAVRARTVLIGRRLHLSVPVHLKWLT